jgi:phospholipid-binding lipoprotein MlaA
VRIGCWICFLSILCLIPLSGLCAVENPAGSPPFESSLSAPPPAGVIPAPGITEPLASPIAAEPSTSLHPAEAPVAAEQGDGDVETSDEDIPAEPDESEEAAETIADPIEPVNRFFFRTNDKIYFWVFKPVATGYKAIIPEDGRIGIRNFFSNLTTPVRLANCLFQARFKAAGNETLRFVVNTTYGLAGVLDTAKKEFNIQKQEADFGQTLGAWGMGPVFYMNLPLLGPSSLRDGLGYAVDTSLNPQTYLAYFFVVYGYVNTGGWILEKINEASLTLGEYESLKKAAFDPYIAVREAYAQHRQNKIRKSGSPFQPNGPRQPDSP